MSSTSPSEHTRHCIKCGRAIGPDESICDDCNRAGMATPSASQYHGTVVAAIVLAVAALAIAGTLSLRGVGPYHGEVLDVSAAEVGYDISYAVTNEGTKSGRAKCQLVATDADGRRLRAVSTLSSPIEGGGTNALTEHVPGLNVEPNEVTITCS